MFYIWKALSNVVSYLQRLHSTHHHPTLTIKYHNSTILSVYSNALGPRFMYTKTKYFYSIHLE